MKFDVNGVAVARHGLILSQDGAMHSRIVFIRVLGLFNAIYKEFWPNMLNFNDLKADFFLTGVGGMGCGPLNILWRLARFFSSDFVFRH